MCEAFWGDLSRVQRGWLGVLHGMFQIIFGLRYVAYVAADQPGKAAHWLRTLGLMSSRVLHGPVLAVTFFLGMLIVAVCGTHAVWPESHRMRVWTTIVILGCSGVALLASQIGTMLTRSRVVERFWFWVNVTTAFVSGVMLVRMLFLDAYSSTGAAGGIHPGLLWYCRILLILLGMLWFIEILVMLAMGVCWAFAVRHKKTYKPALHVAVLLPALAIGIWAQAIPMSWIAAKESLAALTHLKDFSSVFDDAIPFLGVQFAMMAVLMVTTSVVLIQYARWRQGDPLSKFKNGSPPPRLIVNGSLQVMLGLCTLFGIAIVTTLWLTNTDSSLDSKKVSWLASITASANGYAIAAVVPIGGLLIFVLPHLRPAFDILLDVVNHFYFRPTHVEDVLDDCDEFDIAETTFQNGTLFFSRRESLHGRLRKILTHYRDQYDHLPELVIVAHSQGTMVAIETLNDKDLMWLNNAFRKISLITMGSPFHHVYQHFFGHCYPNLDQPFWASFRRRVNHWVNIFRVDDYVGQNIQFPDSTANESDFRVDEHLPAADTGTQANPHRTIFENHPVGPRGHVHYWSDREVLDVLFQRVFGQSETSERRRVA